MLGLRRSSAKRGRSEEDDDYRNGKRVRREQTTGDPSHGMVGVSGGVKCQMVFFDA